MDPPARVAPQNLVRTLDLAATVRFGVAESLVPSAAEEMLLCWSSVVLHGSATSRQLRFPAVRIANRQGLSWRNNLGALRRGR